MKKIAHLRICAVLENCYKVNNEMKEKANLG
jgi:hypothetical protein